MLPLWSQSPPQSSWRHHRDIIIVTSSSSLSAVTANQFQILSTESQEPVATAAPVGTRWSLRGQFVVTQWSVCVHSGGHFGWVLREVPRGHCCSVLGHSKTTDAIIMSSQHAYTITYPLPTQWRYKAYFYSYHTSGAVSAVWGGGRKATKRQWRVLVSAFRNA